jgi:membrane protein DedA with SNARE-associated domain
MAPGALGREAEGVIEFIEPFLTSPWAYALILGIAALDAVVPAVPSEATVISAGLLAGLGELNLAAVISAGAAGALLGDTASYGGGRLLRGRVGPWLQRTPRRRRESERAARLLERRGPLLIVAARFVPGGRTAATLTAGVVGYGFRRFAAWAAAAAGLWATFAGLAGFLGGRVFEEQPLLAFGLSFGVAGAVVVVAAAISRVRSRAATRPRTYGYPYGGCVPRVPPSTA